MTLFVGDQTAETLASRPVRGPLKGVWDSVNSHLQFYYKKNAAGWKCEALVSFAGYTGVHGFDRT